MCGAEYLGASLQTKPDSNAFAASRDRSTPAGAGQERLGNHSLFNQTASKIVHVSSSDLEDRSENTPKAARHVVENVI